MVLQARLLLVLGGAILLPLDLLLRPRVRERLRVRLLRLPQCRQVLTERLP